MKDWTEQHLATAPSFRDSRFTANPRIHCQMKCDVDWYLNLGCGVVLVTVIVLTILTCWSVIP